tara:strand:- start:1745 stop:2770 length:1026 start_codon:yes stop_codon:yes gene_type:complete
MKEFYHKCIDWELDELILQLSGAYSNNRQVPDKGMLKQLLPIKSVFTFYTKPKISWKNPLNDDEKEASISLPLFDDNMTSDEIESMRINAIRYVNEKIQAYNDEVSIYYEKTPFENRDFKRYQHEPLILEWGLNSVIEKPTIKSNQSQKETFGISVINNKKVFKKALQGFTQDEFALAFNKMIYDYICLLVPIGGYAEEHTLRNPIIEFENWFMMNGLSSQHTISLMDLIDGEIDNSPLAQTKRELDETKHLYTNAVKKLKKKSQTIQKLSVAKPEERLLSLIRNQELDELVDTKCRHRASGKVNWSSLSRELGCSDKYAKKLIIKHAPYLARDDEQGYTQ